jgi:amino acid transporter
MLNPPRQLVISLALVALAGLVLGLATGIGLLGWSLAALLALYFAAISLIRLVRPRPHSSRRSA